MILQILTRVLLVPIGSRQKFYLAANAGAFIVASIFSRVQNSRVEELHARLEGLSNRMATEEQMTLDSRTNNFTTSERLAHFVLKIAPVMTGLSPFKLLIFITRNIIQHGYGYTVDNLVGHANSSQQRRAGRAPNPLVAARMGSARSTFPAETRDSQDIEAGREYSNEADLICVYLDEKVVITQGTIFLYLKVLFIFLVARELFVLAGKYLASKKYITIEVNTKKRTTRARRLNPANKTKE